MAKNTRQKHARNQEYRSLVNVSADFSASTARKLSLSALTTVLTAATCLGGQPLLASSNILLPPTTAAFASQVSDANTTPWLHTPNILEFQRYRFVNSNGKTGSTADLGDYDNTTKKSDMYAHIEEHNGAKYLVFDVFFNNDGKSMLKASKQQQYVWQIPFAVADLDNNGFYKPDTLSDLSFDFYKRNGNSAQTTNAVLSRDFSLFTKEDSQSKNLNNPLQDDQHLGNSIYKPTFGIRGGNSNKQDLSNTFHNNAGDGVISNATTLKGVYSGKSYGIGLRTTNADYAVHMHCKVKLRPGVTLDEIQDAYTWANTSTFAKNTNSAYTFISGRERWTEPNLKRTKSDKIPPKLYFNDKEISDSNNSITVYQGDITTVTFGTSDDSGKVTNFSVRGLPDFAKNGNVDEKNIDASESKPYTKVINKTTFIHKDKSGNPVNSDYEVTISATDASGNTAEKKVKIHLKNLNQKYKAPSTTPITVDWGQTATNEELKKHVSNIEGDGKLVFNDFPPTNIPQEYFNGKETLPAKASAKVVYADNSYHVVTIPVNIRKPLSLQHKLNGNTVNATVGDPLTKTGNKVDAKEYLGKLNDATKKKITKAEWVNDEPSTDVAGKRTYTAKVTFNDGSTAEENVTFTVRPQKPTIETDLTGVAGVKGKEVVVDAGPGTEGSTVTLKDNGKKVIGTGKVGADGKVTIKVADGIPAGNVTAVTSTNPADPTKEQSVQSPVSDPKNATKDDKAPTLTGTENVTVKVGKDLKIELTAKDDVKIDDFNIAAPLAKLVNGDFSRLKIEYQGKQDDPKNRKVKITILGMKESEIGEHELKFSVTDAAGNKVEKTVTVKVEKKEDIKPKNITVYLGHKLDEKDAKKAIANAKKLPKGTTFAWANDGKPDTSKLGKEMPGKVVVTIPTNDPKNPRVETVDVKVTVRDNKRPEVVIQQKDGNSYKGIDIKTESESGGKISTQIATITTYRGDKNDIKITATDNSGEVTTLTLTPKTPGEKEKDPTGTGTTADPKTLTLDGTTPLNIEPRTYTRTLKAVDPSGNTNEVTVKFIVKPQADKYGDVKNNPVTYNMSSGTTHPKPEDGIAQESKNKLPNGTKYSWAQEPDWNKPGKDTAAKVRITFADGSFKDVDTKVTVNDDIPPVINTPNTNKAKRADTEQAEYYQFKVHNGKQFNIDINAYDNSGKIKSATLSMPEEITGSKISITDKDNNSAEKPAKITITGTAHRANNTNPDANKWSRELSVTDEAGNTSKLKVQISVYTDAEEHDATPSPTSTPVKNPTDNNAITNAITITKKDDPSSTVDRSKLTFTVGEIPKTDGIHAVPVKITYPDGSTTTVEVPVLIKLQNKIYNPNGKTIEVPWHSNANELINKIKNVNSLTWENNKKPTTDPTVTIVGGNSSVPSTDKVGKSQVQVKVTYSDGSSDVATVTVNVLEPQNKTYTPEGKTIKVDYNTNPNNSIKNSVETNGVKLKKNGADVTLPNDAKVTIDNDNTIPNGTQPGDFTVPVTITYGDGSTDHATVTVKVGEPQNKKYEPEQPDGINVGYGNKTKPSDSDIIAKVKFDDNKQPPSGTTITVDKDQTQIDTKTPGIVNVKVTVKYPDGSEDHVEVPVTVGEPDNVTHKASATPIELHKNEAKPTEKQIKDKVKTGVSASEDQPTITLDKDTIPETTQTGTTNVPVTITYKDKTSTTVQVPVIVKDWNKDEYPPSADPVEEPYGTSKEKTKEAIKNAVTVDWPDKNDTSKPQPTVTITSDDKDIPSGTEPVSYTHLTLPTTPYV